MYVVGTVTVILLTRQFLTHTEVSDTTEDHLLSTKNNQTSYQPHNPAVSAFIYWPFFIGFCFKFLTFVFFEILYIIPTPHEIEENLRTSQNHGKDVGKDVGKDSDKNEDNLKKPNYYLGLVLLLSSAFFKGACHSSFVQYTFSTAVELNNGFNQKDASLLIIVIFGVSFMSLLFTGLAAYYIHVRTLSLTFAFSTIVADTLLAFVGNESSKMFWIFAILKALLITPTVSLSIPYIDSYIQVNLL